MTHDLTDVDPFDLPEWLGEGDVTWETTAGLRSGHHVTGRLCGAGQEVPCDLLAIDEAYPAPVAADDVRSRAHQAWQHGQILLVAEGDRLTLAVPARDFDAELVLDALERLAKAVGASPEHYAARLRIGRDRR
ncbi:hypothetical protein [Nocardioides coralli]|uniref:hypothetical protein n=1 Tax=Nocardioides coralli TaxID=2872154 RepID=UPI001CA3ACDC|nr:hypothetical protein [Nocardioides coralli]QZY27674.1 hypothetical protein K6T13_09075 [Nocardioides coralli]